MNKVILLPAFLLLTACLTAQNEVHSSAIQIIERMTKAPNTASLGKYFEVPVNMSTGIPSIQIPIYTIKSGNATIPISISYHAGGVKVNDPASYVGLGWSLNAGGVVTKKINGLDDDYANIQIPPGQNWVPPYNYYTPDYYIDGDLGFNSMTEAVDSFNSPYTYTHANDLCKFFGRVIRNQYDGEADEYFYNTPEGGGTIYWNQKQNKFQLDKINGWQAYKIDDYWNLDNKTGLTYQFNGKERTLSSMYPPPSTPPTTNFNDYFFSAWYLTRITDRVNSKYIDFNYQSSSYYTTNQGYDQYLDYKGYGGGWLYFRERNEPSKRYGFDLWLTGIEYDGGKVEFIQDTASRLDIANAPKALKTILVYDKNDSLVKKFELSHFYASGRLFLKSIQEVNYQTGSSGESKPYVFNYDTAVHLPAMYSYGQDIYGYNNGVTTNTTSIPTEYEALALGLPAFANRFVDTSYTRACMLKQIVYPMGGSLNFEFENNRNVEDSLTGGMRVKRIVNYDSVAGKSLVTTYKYKLPNGTPSGEVMYRPKFHYFFNYQDAPTDFTIAHIGATPTRPLFTNQGCAVFYTCVEKTEIGDNSDSIRSRHYFMNYFTSGNDVPTDVHAQEPGDYYGVPYSKYPNSQNYTGIEYRTERFKYKNGQFKLQTVDSLEFSTLNHFKNYVWNVQAAWGFSGLWIEWPDNDPYTVTPMNSCANLNLYKLFNESLVNHQTYNKIYDDNNIKSEQAVYKYFDSTNGNLKKTVTIASNGDTLKSYYTYVIDIGTTTSSNPINVEVNTLIEHNMTDLPVEVITTRKKPGGNEAVINANLYLYDSKRIKKIYKINQDMLYSAMTKAHADNGGFYYDTTYTLESEVVSYNTDGNPLEIKLVNKTQSLLWDGEDMTATALNTTQSKIAATSFESAEKGGWSYSGSTASDATAPTGKKCYSLSGGNITRTGLPNTTYIISYWSKNGAYTVTSTSPVRTGKTINGWTYYEHEVTGTSITVSGSGYIDELRLYPKGAQMNTYTYFPAIGMATQCDINNRIIRYEYDGFNRLKLIKDEDGNILKRIDYKNQATTTE